MIRYEQITTEDALRKLFKDSPEWVGKLLKLEDDEGKITVNLTLEYSAPVKYAKAVLKDYISERLKSQEEQDAKNPQQL